MTSFGEQQKKLSELEMELSAPRQEGYVSSNFLGKQKVFDRKPVVVIEILTTFSRKNNRDAIRKAWMTSGGALKQMEQHKGVIARFVIGRSSLIVGITWTEPLILKTKRRMISSYWKTMLKHLKTYPQKTKLYFSAAAEKWDADFFAKVNDDAYVNIDALGNTLSSYANNPPVYIGCMKSGEVFSEQ